MYQPAHFAEHDPQTWLALMRAHPLATLVHHDASGQATIDPLPLRVTQQADSMLLQGHVARANPLWRHADGQTVLAVFHGPQAYVSPGWYPSKAATGKAVPTWNYVLIECRARLRAVDDPAWLRAFLDQLTVDHEAHRAPGWQLEDAPPDYMAAMLRGIVGVELQVQAVAAKFKLSQNRDPADRQGVLAGLDAEPDPAAAALAALMRR